MITKNFVKQCEQAFQLQKNWKPKVGDYVWRKYTFFSEEIDKQFWDKDKMEEIIILTYASEIEGYFHATKDGETRIFNSHNEAHKKTCIWLPTQEQLQEMVSDMVYARYLKKQPKHYFIQFQKKEIAHKILLTEIFNYLIWGKNPKDTSMNELWLAFVMSEKYNKFWTGEKWKEIKC
ncbi:MAG: hypothetical protein KAX28_11095 [Candidatus Marinimicrobia bacterium]|nr:hypothetical protein [Candidatus Neomarinimicrobiota bacterium]